MLHPKHLTCRDFHYQSIDVFIHINLFISVCFPGDITHLKCVCSATGSHGACLISSLGILFVYYQLHQIPDELVILFSYPHHSLLCFANADVNLKLVRRFDLNWFELETSTKIFDFDLKHINLSNWWVHHHFSPFGFFLNWMYVQFLKKMLRMYKKSQYQYLVMLCKWYYLLWQPLQDI